MTVAVDWREARDALDCAYRLKGFLEKHEHTVPVLDMIIQKLEALKDPPKVILDLGS